MGRIQSNRKIMKKASLAFLLVLLTSSLLTAQDRGTKFGFRISPGVSWFNPDMKNVNSTPRLSFGFGAMGDIALLDNIVLSTGLGGNFVGGTMKFNDQAVPVLDTADMGISNNVYLGKATYKLRYVKVPITFKGMTNQIGHMRYFVEFGGSMGFNYLARMDIKDQTPTGNASVAQEDYPIKGMVRSFRFNMLIRAGTEYNLSGETNLVLGLTYDNGLTNTFNPNNVPTFTEGSGNREGKPLIEDGELVPGDDMKAIINDIKINVGVLF